MLKHAFLINESQASGDILKAAKQYFDFYKAARHLMAEKVQERALEKAIFLCLLSKAARLQTRMVGTDELGLVCDLLTKKDID